MPHDQQNTEIKVGDVIKGPSSSMNEGVCFIGVVSSIHKGSDTCNAQMQPQMKIIPTAGGGKVVMPVDFASAITVTLSDCLLIA